MDTKIWVLSSRKLFATPAWASAFELEDLISDWCQATLLTPEAAPVYKYGKLRQGFISKVANKISKTIGDFHKITDLAINPADFNVLIAIDMSADTLRKLSAIPNWRKKFNLVVAHVEDCWLADSFPEYTFELDHLFIPYAEFQAELKARFKIPVTVIPYAFDVLNHGAGAGSRPIDVASYGRTPKNYQLKLYQDFNAPDSGLLYYHQTPEKAVRFPRQTYGFERFDYLHRVQLKQILRNSKINLAFDFNYTKTGGKLDASMKQHPSYKCNQSILTRRWFESIAVGSVVVGKRPQSEMLDEYFGWTDSTIELPEDATEGVDFIKTLLKKTDYLRHLNQTNYVKSLEHNDWRLRLRDMFNILEVSLPEGLKQELDRLNAKIHELNTPTMV